MADKSNVTTSTPGALSTTIRRRKLNPNDFQIQRIVPDERVINTALLKFTSEIKMRLKEWNEEACYPDEINDFNVPMSVLVDKTIKARKQKKARENAIFISNFIEEINKDQTISTATKSDIAECLNLLSPDLSLEKTQDLCLLVKKLLTSL